MVRALGAQSRYLKAELTAQGADLLAAEAGERHHPPRFKNGATRQRCAKLATSSTATTRLSRMPTIICEVSRHNAQAATEILTGHGYTLYDGNQRPGERVAVSVTPFNTLAVAPAMLG